MSKVSGEGEEWGAYQVSAKGAAPTLFGELYWQGREEPLPEGHECGFRVSQPLLGFIVLLSVGRSLSCPGAAWTVPWGEAEAPPWARPVGL